MHTLGTKVWKTVGQPPNSLSEFEFPTCVNGSLFWLVQATIKRLILNFNFESEEFQYFPLPPKMENYEYFDAIKMSIGELRGCLYVYDLSSGVADFWVMKEYGIRESWTMLFSVDILDGCAPWPLGYYWPIKFFENGTVLMCKYWSSCLVYCGPGFCDFKIFKVREIQRKFEAISIIPSLISLKDVVKRRMLKC